MRNIKQLKTCALLFLLTLSILACKKEEVVTPPENILVGAWNENSGSSFERRIIFANEGIFEMEFRDSAKNYWDAAVLGKYSISDDNVYVNITSEVDKSRDGKILKSMPLKYKMFDNGTFFILNDVLTINCTTYPADSPIATTFKYYRIRPID